MDFIEPCFGIGHNLSLICQMTSEDIKHQLIIIINIKACEPVWPSGKALGCKRRDVGSNPFRLSFLFKSCGLWTLSCDFVPPN